ncbi:MAG TPA: hypothetical protein VM621_07460 [Luteibacter sp.]|uniref:hypothetical protein n=1 Tax=Luteibacter sp. TaxID=1886636 RepID=UPI002CBCBDEF|nr:hypothetical protein [Luteibacter sp.]HVI54873.1 hypothetical protein [Luteibacter sp.]
MAWLPLVSYFFGGLFFTNAVPHFISGVTGRAFQSPFAKPSGKGLSSSTINVLWGFFNLVASYALVRHGGGFDWNVTSHAAAFGLGVLTLGLICARLFGRFHGGDRSTPL